MKKKKLAGLLLGACLATMLVGATACQNGGDSNKDPNKNPVVKPGDEDKFTVTLDKKTVSLNMVQSATLKATLSEGTYALVWSSSNESVVKVDKDGNLTPVGVGNATVTVTAGTKSDRCEVTITAAPALAVGVETERFTTYVGESTAQIVPFVDYEGNDLEGVKFTYQSANTNIVSVSEGGVITAKMAGETKITVSASFRGVSITSKEITVTVKSNVQISPIDNIDLYTGAGRDAAHPLAYTYTVSPTVNVNGTTVNDAKITLSTEDTSIISIKDNVITAVGAGTATVIVTAEKEGGSVETTFKVIVRKQYSEITPTNDIYLETLRGTAFSAFTFEESGLPENMLQNAVAVRFAGEAVTFTKEENRFQITSEIATEKLGTSQTVSVELENEILNFKAIAVTLAVSESDDLDIFANNYQAWSAAQTKAYVVLTANINYTGGDNWGAKVDHYAGSSAIQFCGTLDGLGHAISGISAPRAFMPNLAAGSIIKNLAVVNFTKTTGSALGMIGCMISGTIENCYFEGRYAAVTGTHNDTTCFISILNATGSVKNVVCVANERNENNSNAGIGTNNGKVENLFVVTDASNGMLYGGTSKGCYSSVNAFNNGENLEALKTKFGEYWETEHGTLMFKSAYAFIDEANRYTADFEFTGENPEDIPAGTNATFQTSVPVDEWKVTDVDGNPIAGVTVVNGVVTVGNIEQGAAAKVTAIKYHKVFGTTVEKSVSVRLVIAKVVEEAALVLAKDNGTRWHDTQVINMQAQSLPADTKVKRATFGDFTLDEGDYVADFENGTFTLKAANLPAKEGTLTVLFEAESTQQLITVNCPLRVYDYAISTKEDFEKFMVAGRSANAEQVQHTKGIILNDIDLEEATWDNSTWGCISLNGQGYTLSNLLLDNEQGMFGNTVKSHLGDQIVVENLVVTKIKKTGAHAGFMFNYVLSGADVVVRNVYAQGAIGNSDGNIIGGLHYATLADRVMGGSKIAFENVMIDLQTTQLHQLPTGTHNGNGLWGLYATGDNGDADTYGLGTIKNAFLIVNQSSKIKSMNGVTAKGIYYSWIDMAKEVSVLPDGMEEFFEMKGDLLLPKTLKANDTPVIEASLVRLEGEDLVDLRAKDKSAYELAVEGYNGYTLSAVTVGTTLLDEDQYTFEDGKFTISYEKLNERKERIVADRWTDFRIPHGENQLQFTFEKGEEETKQLIYVFKDIAICDFVIDGDETFREFGTWKYDQLWVADKTVTAGKNTTNDTTPHTDKTAGFDAALNFTYGMYITMTEDVSGLEITGSGTSLTRGKTVAGSDGWYWNIEGNPAYWFCGTFDGRGHNISGFQGTSLFRCTSRATIKNFSFTYYKTTGNYMGALVYMAYATTISDVFLAINVNNSGITDANAARYGGVARGAESCTFNNVIVWITDFHKNTKNFTVFAGYNGTYSCNSTYTNCFAGSKVDTAKLKFTADDSKNTFVGSELCSGTTLTEAFGGKFAKNDGFGKYWRYVPAGEGTEEAFYLGDFNILADSVHTRTNLGAVLDNSNTAVANFVIDVSTIKEELGDAEMDLLCVKSGAGGNNFLPYTFDAEGNIVIDKSAVADLTKGITIAVRVPQGRLWFWCSASNAQTLPAADLDFSCSYVTGLEIDLADVKTELGLDSFIQEDVTLKLGNADVAFTVVNDKLVVAKSEMQKIAASGTLTLTVNFGEEKEFTKTCTVAYTYKTVEVLTQINADFSVSNVEKVEIDLEAVKTALELETLTAEDITLKIGEEAVVFTVEGDKIVIAKAEMLKLAASGTFDLTVKFGEEKEFVKTCSVPYTYKTADALAAVAFDFSSSDVEKVEIDLADVKTALELEALAAEDITLKLDEGDIAFTVEEDKVTIAKDEMLKIAASGTFELTVRFGEEKALVKAYTIAYTYKTVEELSAVTFDFTGEATSGEIDLNAVLVEGAVKEDISVTADGETAQPVEFELTEGKIVIAKDSAITLTGVTIVVTKEGVSKTYHISVTVTLPTESESEA